MKVGERGQITIPMDIRRRYGLEANSEVELVERDGKLILRKKKSDECPIDDFVGVLGEAEVRTDDLVEELRGR